MAAKRRTYISVGVVVIVCCIILALVLSRTGDSLPSANNDSGEQPKPLETSLSLNSQIAYSETKLQKILIENNISGEGVVIDWATQAAAIATYSAPTGGYAIRSYEVEYEEDSAKIMLAITPPGNNCTVTQAFQTLTKVVPVKRSTKNLIVESKVVESETDCPNQKNKNVA